MQTFEVHPIAAIFPPMTEDKFAELVADIKEHGLDKPVVLFEDKILDGVHRRRACAEAGIDCRFEQWEPRHEGDTPLAFVMSANRYRRQLTPSQAAMIAAKSIKDPFAKKAPRVTAGQAAKAMNVSVGNVQRAKRVLKKGIPELVAKVDSGDLTVRGAADIAAKSPTEQRGLLDVPEPEPKPKTERLDHHGTGERVLVDIVAFLDANERRETKAIDRATRVELATRFLRMLHVCNEFPRKAAKADAPKWRIPQGLPRSDHINPELKRQLAPKPPKDASDEVAAFLANGGQIKKLPTAAATETHGIQLSESDALAIAEHDAQRAAIGVIGKKPKSNKTAVMTMDEMR